MEYIISRAYDVCRLSYENLIKLQIKEKNIKRGLIASEIQAIFSLPLIKQAYLIPDNESAQSIQNQRLRNDFKAVGLIPLGGDISITDLEAIHRFDELVRAANDDLRIDLVFSMAKVKRKLSDQIDEF